jgi:dTDP-glucose pyrophosphorylase
MKNLDNILISPETTLLEVIQVIDKAQTQVALVINSKQQLLGTLTDGDIRRALLSNAQLTETVESYMFKTPTKAKVGESDETLLLLMRKIGINQIPILDSDGRVVDLKLLSDYLKPVKRDNWVIVMAGGLGSRLKELTKDTPKPMLNVGDRPLLETIVREFVSQGFHNIWLAVNFQADKIENHFGNGKDFDANIRYLREDKRLGTAGALSLLPNMPELPVIVMNADLLTSVDYGEMIDTHIASSVDATMAVREFEYQIPYGVVRTEKEFEILGLEEKPIHRSLVNAGMYVLSPDMFKYVPENTFFDMTELFTTILNDDQKVIYHRVHGYWLDIGRHEDFHQANCDFPENFL